VEQISFKETTGHKMTQPSTCITATGFKASTTLLPNSINTTNSLSQIKTLSSEEMFLSSLGNNRINSNKEQGTIWVEESLEPLAQPEEIDVGSKSKRMAILYWSILHSITMKEIMLVANTMDWKVI